ncbi:MAG TPA: alpha/beta hydrolase [Solirubrobacteraceae bacterium]|nr:alpha/beta hydrolase [Solirubrobacteraceae bacterium]
MAAPIREHEVDFDGQPVRWLEAPGAPAPILYLHGVPDEGAMWRPFLQAGGGIAVDLPGFGRSGKSAALDFTIDGYARFLERFLDRLELERVRLAAHDWGVVGLALAQAHPERVERVALIDAVPFLPGYRWHPVARIWRTRVLGELFMGAASRWAVRRLTDLPRAEADRVWGSFDQGTQRAILRLYRASDPAALARAGLDLGRVRGRALVLWGEDDPYIPARFADAYGAALPHATVERIPGAGHWPWLDRPELVDRVARWMAAD